MCPKRSSGVSLIELVVFIIILGIGLAGAMVFYNTVTQRSVDPLVRKQVLAIATSLLEEIELRGFTYCDPDDANVYTATSSGGCATTPEAIGPEAGEVRSQFDNVNDYNGFTMATITDITGSTVPNLAGYQVTSVSIAPVGLVFGLADNQDALSISVTVTGPSSVGVTLQGFRFRYAPNSP